MKDVLDLLAAGATREEILADYSNLEDEDEDITTVLEFAGPPERSPRPSERMIALPLTVAPAIQVEVRSGRLQSARAGGARRELRIQADRVTVVSAVSGGRSRRDPRSRRGRTGTHAENP